MPPSPSDVALGVVGGVVAAVPRRRGAGFDNLRPKTFGKGCTLSRLKHKRAFNNTQVCFQQHTGSSQPDVFNLLHRLYLPRRVPVRHTLRVRAAPTPGFVEFPYQVFRSHTIRSCYYSTGGGGGVLSRSGMKNVRRIERSRTLERPRTSTSS